ncbi:hypothetical protein BN946_scf184941.g5 [Trametes cinnabarina]|uniref:F-box domain-containing protein n=1 Tax=Pycnoporus cinnabarinus TaxID=5643 RepID=A0A060SM95_PYCCI|nr:hypothetical protein BN946_scf184941.g5 [Trametes cinnabarina]
MDSILAVGYALLDKGLVPDYVLRPTIRALCRQRLREIDMGSFEANYAAKMKWIEDVRARSKIAELTEKANSQHYEVSTPFMLSCMGPYAKYSCCLYPTGQETLEEAEILMMESYCEKAQLKDGWGSLSLFLAQKYPHSRITGLSNSSTQKAHIDGAAKVRGLTNLEVSNPSCSWYISGEHYARTSEDWLRRQDANATVGLSELEKDAVAKGLDKEEGRKAFYRFRVFYIAVAEFFGLHDGQDPQLVKVAQNRADQSNITGCSMKDMPWDVLTEIFKFAHPLDLLSLSRTSKALRGFLMSRKSAFVWKAARERESAAQVARERVSDRKIPECPPELSEAQYAVLLFTSECTVCGEPGVPGTMWELLARYCPECKERDLVSIEQIRAVKTLVWDVIGYSKPIFLHGQTFFGGVWLYDESGVFPRHKIREFGKSYVACRTPDEKDKLLEGLHAQHVRLSNLGIRLRGWGTSEDERRRQEIDVIKKKRAEQIIERLREAGWGEELDKMSPRRMSALRRLGIVDKGVPLTDERWEGIRDALMQHMEFVQACRLNREWQAVVLERLRWLQEIVADDTSITSARRDSTDYGMGGDLRVEFSDVAMFPELRTLLEAPAAEEIKKEDLAERCIRCLPVLKDKWMRQREAYFNDLVRQAPRATPLPDGLVASLAIVTFTCKRCTCPWIRWPDVSNHHCGRMEPYYRGDKDDTSSYTEVLTLFCREKHLTLPWHFDPEYEVEFASEATEGVIRLCGYDPLRTSYKEMQDCGVRLYCKTCAVSFDGCLEVYDWQNARIPLWWYPLNVLKGTFAGGDHGTAFIAANAAETVEVATAFSIIARDSTEYDSRQRCADQPAGG